MRAMILAAGRGERMGELTTHTPKPLLRVAERYLIEYAIANLVHAGIREIVINISYHAEQIKAALGDGTRYGASIYYSEENNRLETGGGILQALPLLGEQFFLVMSSDVITNYPIKKLLRERESLAHLILVNNPPYHSQGDYGLTADKVTLQGVPRFTFASMGLYHPDLFSSCSPGHFRLTQVLNPAIMRGQVTGEHYTGLWYNIGTPQDLDEANHVLKQQNFIF